MINAILDKFNVATNIIPHTSILQKDSNGDVKKEWDSMAHVLAENPTYTPNIIWARMKSGETLDNCTWEYDKRRKQVLTDAGYKVITLWETDIRNGDYYKILKKKIIFNYPKMLSSKI